MLGTMMDFPLALPHLFQRAEQLFAKKEIITSSPKGIERTTYGEWADRSRRLGSALDTLGISPGGRVGTFGWNTARHLELYFAVPCSGRVCHTINLRLFPEQLLFIVNHAEDEVLFIDNSIAPLAWPALEHFKTVKHVVVMNDTGAPIPTEAPNGIVVHDYEELIANESPMQWNITDENTAAAMMYTSGTTGNPKGVVYTHRSIVLHTFAAMMADVVGMRESDVVLPVVPMFHANAWGLAHAAVATGATLIMPGPDLTPPSLVKLMEDYRVTLAAGVPTIWMGVLNAIDGHDVSSLRLIPCGGSAVPPALSEGFRAKIGLPIFQAWGMTETSPVAAATLIKSYLEDTPELRATVGLVVPGVEFRVTEPNTIDELPWDGESRGELQVRGPWVTGTYYNDLRSAESFTTDGWLRTGDVATVDSEGYIRLVDRTKDLVKSGGEWISSVDLENEIMAHPDVVEAAVIGIAHPKWDERPLACVVLAEGSELTEAELLEWLAPRVAKWWLPDGVEFIDEVPKTSVGKFSKKDLRDRFADFRWPES
ncbi:MAG TPA: long-chain fatty acid--CoA ligase [Microthrixaceae bacterium]|mgnify:CR=1 FL=1|nr:long-chain fatty acid--CoA ligase [Microthrixaceae bacterium]